MNELLTFSEWDKARRFLIETLPDEAIAPLNGEAFILVSETHQFWDGRGTTRDIDSAKKYATWRAANMACSHIKKTKFKFTTIEEYVNENWQQLR